MQTFTHAADLATFLATAPRPVAFVPTMGALHAGHLALIEAARKGHATVVASIFVNPTQFNDQADLAAYPRTEEADARSLDAVHCDALYLPTVADVYPENYTDPTKDLSFGQLTEVMEGAQRPGHFAGVAQVVYRLLDIVRPDTLVMGQKDYQQVAVVRDMLRQLEKQLPFSVTVQTVPTVREADGLALSSRNTRLGKAERAAAATINLQLKAVAAGVRAGWSPRTLETTAMREMGEHALLEPEYVSVFAGGTLQPWSEGDSVNGGVVVATAVRCGLVRLIDNLVVIPSER